MKKEQHTTKMPSNSIKRKKSKPNHKHKLTSSDDNIDADIENKKKIVNTFISKKFWDLYVDIYLLYAFSISYGVFLINTNNNNNVGQIFVVFALVLCTMISFRYYMNMKKETETALKDLEVLFK